MKTPDRVKIIFLRSSGHKIPCMSRSFLNYKNQYYSKHTTKKFKRKRRSSVDQRFMLHSAFSDDGFITAHALKSVPKFNLLIKFTNPIL